MATVASRKQENAVLDASDYTSSASQDLSVKGGGGVAELGMLDQEAFARVIVEGLISSSAAIESLREGEEQGEEEVEDDVAYCPGLTEVVDPVLSLRISCLPVLDIFVCAPTLSITDLLQSTQLLKIMSSHPYSTTAHIATDNPSSPVAQTYASLLHLFDTTKRELYSEAEEEQFLDPDILGFKTTEERKVIRKTNIATLLNGIFGSGGVGFFHLHQEFLFTLAPDGGRLWKEVARLYLDLKTQVQSLPPPPPPIPPFGKVWLLMIGVYFVYGSRYRGPNYSSQRIIPLDGNVDTSPRYTSICHACHHRINTKRLESHGTRIP